MGHLIDVHLNDSNCNLLDCFCDGRYKICRILEGSRAIISVTEQ